MRRARALAGAVVVSAALAPGGFAAPLAACAGGSAALVVDLGAEGDVYRYCVSLPADSVSGIELIQLAAEQHGLQYRLGYGGQAVCQLQGVGPDGDDCFGDYPDFWGYWHGNGDGGWNWSSSGAGSYRVEAGDVEGWSWGSGQDGSTHPAPPATTYESLCGSTPAPKPSSAPGDSSGGGNGGSGSGGKRSGGGQPDGAGNGGSSGGGGAGTEPSGSAGATGGDLASSPPPGQESKNKPKRRPKRAEKAGPQKARNQGRDRDETAEPAASPFAATDEAPAALTATSDPASGAPPVAGVVAISAAGLVVAGAAVASRRRRRG